MIERGLARTELLMIIGLIFCSLSIKAQNQTTESQEGLLIRGVITSLILEEDKISYVIKVKLRNELTNTGTTPLIFWNYEDNDAPGALWHKKYLCAGFKLSRNPEFDRKDIMYEHWGGPSIYGGTAWDNMRRALDQKTPPSKVTITLLPNQSMSFDSEVKIYCSKGPYQDIDFNYLNEVGNFWLRPYYEVWSFNLEANPRKDNFKLGKKLQRRWERYGKLLLDHIYTKPIRIDLKTATHKVLND